MNISELKCFNLFVHPDLEVKLESIETSQITNSCLYKKGLRNYGLVIGKGNMQLELER